MDIVKIPGLTEKVFTDNATSDPDENKDALRKFFLEYASRKRGEDINIDGFYGGIIIMQDKWAAKVNEEDGKGYHIYTNMNLVRFLNNEQNDHLFGTESQAGKVTRDEDEVREMINNNDVAVSLLSNKDSAKILIYSYNNNYSAYQISRIKDILDIAAELVEDYPNGIRIGFTNSDRKMEDAHYTLELKEEIEEFLSQYEATTDSNQPEGGKSL